MNVADDENEDVPNNDDADYCDSSNDDDADDYDDADSPNDDEDDKYYDDRAIDDLNRHEYDDEYYDNDIRIQMMMTVCMVLNITIIM